MADDSPWAPDDPGRRRDRIEPTGLDDAWAPPGERRWIPPPRQPSPDVAESAVVERSISTGPVEAVRRPRARVLGRTIAVLAAGLLLGGGGYLALAAGSAGAGAGSPEQALRGALDALAAEDLIGAAEFVEPTERELLVEAGFDVVEELIRLEVLDSALDLEDIEGIDLEVTDLRLSTATVHPDIAHVYIEGGRWIGSLEVSALPLGPLILERAPDAWLGESDAIVERLEGVERPVVAVKRDDRWYISLWYSLAENLRLDAGRPFSVFSPVIDATGAASPAAAVEELVEAGMEFDLGRGLALVHPREARVLYDYAPVFLRDAQEALDQREAELLAEGWRWSVDALELAAAMDGDRAVVTVEELSFTASHGGDGVALDLDGGELQVVVRDGGTRAEVVSDGNCTTVTFHDDDAPARRPEVWCLDDLDGHAPLGGRLLNLYGAPMSGLVVTQLDGRWFVSPTRTGTDAVLRILRGLDPTELAAAVDAVIDFMADPSASIEGVSIEEPTTPIPLPTVATRTTDHIDLFQGDRPLFVPRDLEGDELVEELRFWVPDATDIGYHRGFTGSVAADTVVLTQPAELVVVVVEAGPDVALGPIEEVVPGVLVSDGPFPYVTTQSAWGSPVYAARIPGGIVLVATYEGWTDELLVVLTEQVQGR